MGPTTNLYIYVKCHSIIRYKYNSFKDQIDGLQIFQDQIDGLQIFQDQINV